MYTLTGKPNSTHDSADGVADGKFFNKVVYLLAITVWNNVEHFQKQDFDNQVLLSGKFLHILIE